MLIKYFAGTNYSSAPTWLPTVLNEVASFYDKLFTNNITIDVTVNWVPLSGGDLASNSGFGGVTDTFSTVSAALVGHAQYATQKEAYANMPTGAGNVFVASGEAEVLGLMTGSTAAIQLDMGSTASWIPDGGDFDPFGAIAHEITEVAMGRIGNPGPDPDTMDLFRFSAPGVPDLTPGTTHSNTTAYFSVNGGTTNLGTWNNAAGQEDFGDWVVQNFPVNGDPEGDPVFNDAYGVQEGGETPVSETDIELMNVLGWSTDIVTSGNTLSVHGAQSLSGFDVMAGAEVVVQSGGRTSGFTYTNGKQFDDGVLAVGSSGGLTGVSVIESGGHEVSAVMDGGGVEWIRAGGEAQRTTVNAFGTVVDSGLAEDAVLSAHGRMDVESRALEFFDNVLSGGRLVIYAGGVGSGNTIENGGIESVLGTARSDTVLAGGADVIGSGGIAIGAALSGAADIDAGGVDSGMTVFAGGQVSILSGGIARGATVSSGGREFVLSGASASQTTVSSGGLESISLGGGEHGLAVSFGGTVIDNGEAAFAGAGTLAGTLSGSGKVIQTAAGDLLVSGSGATFSGEVVLEGGTVELATFGAIGTGKVAFVAPSTGSAVLQIDAADAPAAGGTFANTLDNFSATNEDIDLASIPFVAGATATVSGSTLVLSDGGKTYKFSLAGSIAGAYPVLSDSHGDTLIDPQARAPDAASQQVLAFAQAAAAFAPTDAARTALFHAASPGGQTAFLHATAATTSGHV
jgi:autotransporter passenger strand-loop-strand repeat protein